MKRWKSKVTPASVFIFLLTFLSPLLSPFNCAEAADDVTSSVQIESSRSLYNRRTGDYSFDATLKNVSSNDVSAPLVVVISNISSPEVTVANPDGTDPYGNPYFEYTNLLGNDNILSSGEVSAAKKWVFHNPRNVRFTYTTQVLSGELEQEDSVPPVINMTNPINNSTIGTQTPYITIEYSDDNSGVAPDSFTASIDGIDYSDSFQVTETKATYQPEAPLEIGSHNITVSIADNAGNGRTLTCEFDVGLSEEPIRYIFSLSGNNWVFASAGDGVYKEYLRPGDLGLREFSDIVGFSEPWHSGDIFFSLYGEAGIYDSSADGTKTRYFDNSHLGLAESDSLVAEHIDFDGSAYFALKGISGILWSLGDGTNSLTFTNENLGLNNDIQIGCLYIGYDGVIYFCRSDQPGIFQSNGDGNNSEFLSPADLGVPDSTIDAFAFVPESHPPTLTITNPIDGAFLNTVTPTITIAFSDVESGIDKGTFYAEINGVDMTSAFSVTVSGATYQVPSENPLPVGANTLMVKIKDRAGNEATVTSNFTIGILRAKPGATPTSGPASLTVHFTTDGEDPAGTIEVYRWDFDGNGSWDTYDTVARDYNHTYNSPGTYNATLFVQSSTGQTATASIPITVQNNPPTATADLQPSNGAVPLTVQMIGSGSDVDGHIVLYEWDFDGDGTYDWSSSTTGNTTHTYTEVGTFNAIFRVTDDSGLTATAQATTTVIRTGPPGSPTAIASANPTSGNAPLTVNLSGTANDPDNDVVLYEWDFDSNGIYDWSSSSNGNTSHTYTSAGTHIATLRVTDSTGLTGIDQVLITVNIQTSLSVERDTVGFSGDQGITARASSQYSSGYPPSNAIDNNSNTLWWSGYGDTAGSWFEVSFSTPQIVSGLSISWYSSSYRFTRGKVEFYDKNNSQVYSQETDLTGNTSTVEIPSIENITRVRLVALETAYAYYSGIREFTVNSTPMPGSQIEPTGTNINTSISAGSPVSILIKDADGNVVRTLVNNEYREKGTYSDYWDCRDDNGVVVNDGLYYAVLQYIVDGKVQTYDLTDTTGGVRYSFPIGSGCNTRSGNWTETFKPFEDQQVAFTFTLCSAQEVTFFIGPLWGGSDQTRIRTILNRAPFPAGTHTIYWDGLDDNGNIARPSPGDRLITGAWRYTLPNNAIYMTGGTPKILGISANPNYFSPFSEKCDENGNGEGIIVDYTVSEDVTAVEFRVYSVETGALLRTINLGSAQAGTHTIFWDGKNNNGEYVDIGDYRIGITATDSDGNSSIFRYTLVRIDY